MNKTTKLHLIHIEFTLQYITLIDNYIIKDTLGWQVMTTPLKLKQKQYSEQNDKIAFDTHRIYITIYHNYWLLYCKKHIKMASNDNTIKVEK